MRHPDGTDCGWYSVKKLRLDPLLERGAFEMHCPKEQLTTQQLSSATVGVSGCGTQGTYVWNCPHNQDFFSPAYSWVLKASDDRRSPAAAAHLTPLVVGCVRERQTISRSRHMTLARRSFGLTLVASLALGCGGHASGPAASPSAAANQRLQGNWRLLGFQPSLELEAPLKGLLDAQLKTLTISFANGEFTAAGPGVDTGGRYEITDAAENSLTGRVYDRAGAAYGISGDFVGLQFRFTSTDTPWAGTGVLERAQ